MTTKRPTQPSNTTRPSAHRTRAPGNSATAIPRMMAFAGISMPLLLGSGCSDSSKIEKKAEWLCKQDLLDEPKLANFSTEHPADKYIASKDLSLLRKEEEKSAAFAALAIGLKNVGLGVQGAFAERTTCEVDVAVAESGEQAVATIKQTRPDWSMSNGLEGLGELAELESKEKVQERVGDLIDEAGGGDTTTDFEVTFMKENDQWVALYDIEKRREAAERERELERQRAEIERDLERLQDDKKDLAELVDKATKATETLAKFKVSNASFKKGKDAIGMARPSIGLTVENGTKQAIAGASFLGRLSSSGRSVPWLEESFRYTIPGGLEPGESATWQLAPNPFSAWGTVEAPDDATLSVTVVSLDGAEDTVVAELPRKPRSFDGERLNVEALRQNMKEIDEKISELQSRRDSL